MLPGILIIILCVCVHVGNDCRNIYLFILKFIFFTNISTGKKNVLSFLFGFEIRY